MPYNYRVVRLPKDEDDYDDWVEIRRVYYDNTGHRRVYDYLDEETELDIEKISPDSPVMAARCPEDLIWMLEKMLAATKKEIVEIRKLKV